MSDKANNKVSNYTEAQENLIRDRAAANGGTLNYDDAKALASDPRMNKADGGERNPRSIVAKIGRMTDIDYKSAPTNVTKTGEPVVKKTDLVAEIAAIVSGNLDGLEKAPKPALVAIAGFVKAANAS